MIDYTAVTTIVTHDNCADGLASALILHNALPSSEVLFVQHTTPELLNLKAEPGMLFCDICPPAHRVSEFLAAGAVVLDHHKTAKSIVDAFVAEGRGVFADEVTEPGVSGAMLAYREVWMYARPFASGPVFDAVKDMATVAAIRDTWQHTSPRWAEACEQQAALLFWPRNQWLASTVSEWDRLLAIGPTLIAKRTEEVARAVKRASRFTVAGRRVVCFEGPSLTSDAAELLHDEADVVVGFGFEHDGTMEKVIFSLRSHTDFDCAAFARARNGGGHTQAAGFSMWMNGADVQPYAMIRRELGRA